MKNALNGGKSAECYFTDIFTSIYFIMLSLGSTASQAGLTLVYLLLQRFIMFLSRVINDDDDDEDDDDDDDDNSNRKI